MYFSVRYAEISVVGKQSKNIVPIMYFSVRYAEISVVGKQPFNYP